MDCPLLKVSRRKFELCRRDFLDLLRLLMMAMTKEQTLILCRNYLDWTLKLVKTAHLNLQGFPPPILFVLIKTARNRPASSNPANSNMPYTYEDKFPIIEREIRKRKNKWQLNILRHMSFEDVEQILKLHIWKKWHLWDQTRKLEPWISRVCSHQIMNLFRNLYTNYARPCVQCKHSLGEEGCEITPSREQCAECPLYAKWCKSKKNGYHIKMPLELENHAQEVNSQIDEGINYQETFRRLQEELNKVFSPEQSLAFKMFFVEKLSDEEAAEALGYKRTKNKYAFKKEINQKKEELQTIVRRILKESDIGEFWP